MADPVLDNPLSFDVSISRRGKIMYLPVWKDKNDVPLMTKAKQLLIKPVYEPFAVQLIVGTFAKQRSEVDAFCGTYNNKVNAGGWRAWAGGRAWVMDISTDPGHLNDQEIDEVQVTVACLTRKWNSFAPNVGYNYLDGADLKTFKASDGLRYIGKLDASGDELALGSDMEILEFEYKDSIDFTGLGF